MRSRALAYAVATGLCVTAACSSTAEPLARPAPSPERSRARFEVPIEKQPRVTSLRRAVGLVGRHVRVPANLPSPLPSGVGLDGRRPLYLTQTEGEWSASLYLTVPRGGTMLIQWGSAGFDGCGGDAAKPIRVGGERGLILVHRYKSLINTQLIWPARRKTLEGTYGISAQLSPRRVLALAESMSPSRASPTGATQGC